jgi:hypothetical protein
MRTALIIGMIVFGLVILSGITAVASNGRDHTGQTVRTNKWADDVCGTVGAWEGAIKGIREEWRRNNWAARRSDGSTGDSNEQVVTVRGAVNRAILATQKTLQQGLRRAGIPDANQGAAASSILRGWAQQTETNLRVAKAQLKQRPTSVSEAFAQLVPPITAIANSAVEGRKAFAKAGALDPAIADAFKGSGTCRRLMKRQP